MSSVNATEGATDTARRANWEIIDSCKPTLEASAVEFQKEKKFSDSTLQKLLTIFGPVLERAIDLYEKGKFIKITAFDPQKTGIWKDIYAARSLIQVQGLSGESYTIFPGVNYCPCPAFKFHVLGDHSRVTCKHLLAYWCPTTMMNSQNEEFQFVAKLGNLRTVVQLLRSVNFRESAMCFATDNGLKITVEDSKCIQANAYIPTNIFREYDLKDDVIFKINLTVLVECLGMFWSQIAAAGTSVALQIYYKGAGYPVTVLIEEDGIITDCSLKTQQPDQLLDFQIPPDDVLNKVILQTELLRDIWSELDPTCEFIELLLSPKPPYFQIGTDGLAGECRIELPHDSDLIDSFECKTEANFYYKFAHMKPAMRALGCANKVSVRTNEIGLLCFQYMVKTDEDHTCYVEYYLSPVLDTDV